MWNGALIRTILASLIILALWPVTARSEDLVIEAAPPAIPLDTSIFRRMTDTLGSDAFPVWSPRSQVIPFDAPISAPEASQGSLLFVKKDGRIPGIYMINSNGSDLRQIVDAQDIDSYFIKASALSPDGETIAFTTETGTYLIDPDGSNLRPLSEISSPFLSWSPDSTQIAFVSFSETNNRVMVIDVMSQDTLMIMDIKQNGIDNLRWLANDRIVFQVFSRTLFMTTSLYSVNPDGSDLVDLHLEGRISPDGTHVMRLVEQEERDFYRLVITDLSTGQEQVLAQDLYESSSYEWSPDGQFIAFVGLFKELSTEIFIIRRDGRERRVVTSSRYYKQNVRWSPDGTQLVFRMYNEFKEGTFLYRTNIDGSQSTLVMETGDDLDFNIEWMLLSNETAASPLPEVYVADLAFVSDREGSREIYVMDQYGRGIRRLTDNQDVSGTISWSPDGTQIAFYAQGRISAVDVESKNISYLYKIENPVESLAWSPDGTQLAFSALTSMYLIGVDGSNLQQLTEFPSISRFPSWSPDGSQLAFVDLGDDGQYRLAVLDLETETITPIIELGSRNAYPVWSPDGSQILFSQEQNTRIDLYTIDSDGDHLRQLTASDSFDGMANWSPDGSQIVFVSYLNSRSEVFIMDASAEVPQSEVSLEADRGDAPPLTELVFSSNRDGDFDLYLIDTNGQHLQRVTDRDSNERDPMWSPDGNRIVYVSDEDGDYEIYTLNISGDREKLTHNKVDDRFPSWSPDGTQIVFMSATDVYDFFTVKYDVFNIFIMDAYGKNVSQQTERGMITSYVSPVWLPDGEAIGSIGYYLGSDGTQIRLYTQKVNDEEQTRIGDVAYSQITFPAWSPDGTQIVYTWEEFGRFLYWPDNFALPHQVYLMAPDGTDQRHLIPFSSRTSAGSWSPDGEWLSFMGDENGNSNLYIVKADGTGLYRLTNNLNIDEHPSWRPTVP